MKACKLITKESSQKFTEGRSKEEGYSFLRPAHTFSFQNKTGSWGRGGGALTSYLGKSFTHTHTHKQNSALQKNRKLGKGRRISGGQAGGFPRSDPQYLGDALNLMLEVLRKRI